MSIDPRAVEPGHPLWFRVAFGAVEAVGPARLAKLRARFGDLESAWSAPEPALAATVGPKTAASIARDRRRIDVARLLRAVADCDARLLPAGDPAYPLLLAEIATPPDLLYVRGNEAALAAPAVAVVGTRNASDYGRKATWRLVQGLVDAGLAITSGLARGIDATAHEAALEERGTTVAVLGRGIDRCYPVDNAALMARILGEGGAVVSEYPPGIPPRRHRFPARNRIVSGLSLATLVVEAGQRSGASITAGLALDQGREVFAVPGPIDSPTSIGSNRLLAAGAGVALEAGLIVEALSLERSLARTEVRAAWPMDEAEETVLGALGALGALGSGSALGSGGAGAASGTGGDGMADRSANRHERTSADGTADGDPNGGSKATRDSEATGDSKATGGVAPTRSQSTGVTSDELAQATGLPAAEVARALAMLELKGGVERVGGVRWRGAGGG
jgi:DNA processing protein